MPISLSLHYSAKYILLDFTKYLSFHKWKRTAKSLMFRSIYEIREFVLNLLQKGSTGTSFW